MQHHDDGLVSYFQGEDSYIKLLDEIYHTMRGRGGDVLFFFVDDRLLIAEWWRPTSACVKLELNVDIFAERGGLHVLFTGSAIIAPCRRAFSIMRFQIVYGDAWRSCLAAKAPRR